MVEDRCNATGAPPPYENMADSEFEQLFYSPPTTLYPKSTVDPYTLVHGIAVVSPSPDDGQPDAFANKTPVARLRLEGLSLDDSWRLASEPARLRREKESASINSEYWGPPTTNAEGTRKRRKLPEIPKIRRAVKTLSLAEELGSAIHNGPVDFIIGGVTRPLPLLKTLRCEDSSPDSDKFVSNDVDSGNSTAHSPDLLKSGSPIQDPGSFTPISASTSSDRMAQLELLDPTHRGLHRFVPRHRDEVEIDIGDPIYVNKEAEDLWCEGINLRTGVQGIFPSAHVVDVDYSDLDPSLPKVHRERFILGYLGSVETLAHKGNSVLCQAVKKIRKKDYTPHSCILEVSDTGIRMVDRKKSVRKEVANHDYFYSLKNVSFCAFHPRDQRYMGFITKHPSCDRFACHVFVGCESTRAVAEAVGRAFNRFYQKYIETAFPVEDIYIE